MRRILLPLLVAACVSDDARTPAGDDPAHDASDAEAGLDGAACTAEVTWIEPEADFRYAATDAPIEAGFSEPLPRWADWSLEVEGVPGTATLSADGRLATFVPDAPLDHERRYVVRAEACGRSQTIAFGTRPAAVTAADLADRAWGVPASELDLLSATTSLLLPYVSFDGFVLTARPDARTPGVLRLVALLEAAPEARSPCRAEVDLGRIDLAESPRFTTAPADIRVPREEGGDEVSLGEVLITGTFGGLGARLLDVRMQAQVDVRPIEDHIGGGLDLCAAAAIMGEPCAPCADGAPHCLTTIVTFAEADDRSGASDLPQLPPLCP